MKDECRRETESISCGYGGKLCVNVTGVNAAWMLSSPLFFRGISENQIEFTSSSLRVRDSMFSTVIATVRQVREREKLLLMSSPRLVSRQPLISRSMSKTYLERSACPIEFFPELHNAHRCVGTVKCAWVGCDLHAELLPRATSGILSIVSADHS